ncbi:Capreomycidine synthase [Penicillium rolfsii]|nr:Capreomycidine synthase [Penicillium rolfsii]
MGQLEAFAVEQWMNKYETTAKYNTAETCCASMSIDDLRELSEDKDTNPLTALQSTKLTYGAIRGSDKLRGTLSNLYSVKIPGLVSKDNVLITAGAIQANFLLLYALIGPGDHVICHYPTYQQLYSVPASLGAEVSLWKSKEANDWQVDIEELKSLIRPNTKLIIINNPQNPTGAIIPRDTLQSLVDFARESSITLFADEVYRPLFHNISPMDSQFPPSLLSFGYKQSVVTGSVSKAYSLAGLRVGWIASLSDTIIEACANSRDYTTISVGQIDDAIASFALAPDCIHNILKRNLALGRTNLAILEKFIESHRWACDWVKPRAGTTAFVRFNKMGKPVNDVAFCEMLQDRKGVMFVPGSLCFGGGEDFKGYVRIGYACETEVLEKGLEALREFMEDDYDEVPALKKAKAPQ